MSAAIQSVQGSQNSVILLRQRAGLGSSSQRRTLALTFSGGSNHVNPRVLEGRFVSGNLPSLPTPTYRSNRGDNYSDAVGLDGFRESCA